MNDRIKQLADEATSYADTLDVADQKIYQEIRDREFAELIVKECANQCDLLLDHKISSEWSRGTHDCSRAIKKHFGVES
jgi:hypothetical protein